MRLSTLLATVLLFSSASALACTNAPPGSNACCRSVAAEKAKEMDAAEKSAHRVKPSARVSDVLKTPSAPKRPKTALRPSI